MNMLPEPVDAQTDVVLDVHDRLSIQQTIVTALCDDLRRTTLIQGRLHKVVMVQLEASTTTIITEIRGSTRQLDGNDQRILAVIEHLRAEFAIQRTQLPTAPGNYAKRNEVQGNIEQTNTGNVSGINYAGDNTVGGNLIQNNHSGGFNLSAAHISRMVIWWRATSTSPTTATTTMKRMMQTSRMKDLKRPSDSGNYHGDH